MTFAGNSLDPSIEKHLLVTVRPRRYVTDWTLVSGVVYSTPFSYGPVTRVWLNYLANTLTQVFALADVTAGKWFHDFYAGVLYVGAVSLPSARGVEYQISMSDQAFTGPMDPLDDDSQIVEWLPVLGGPPSPKDGDRTNLFGFVPLAQASIGINNSDGWMNIHLHDSSFTKAPVSAYVMANSDYDLARAGSDIQRILNSYAADRLTGDARNVQISVTSFWQFLDQAIVPGYRFSETLDFSGYNIQLDASIVNAEWYVRMIRGRIDGHVPVNVDQFPTPGTTVNRDWVTHEDDRRNNDVGTLTYTEDHLAANTATKTFFTTTPKVCVDDWMILNRNGTAYRRKILSVDRTNKWVTHAAIADTVMSGNTATRWYVAAVWIDCPGGARAELEPGRDFNLTSFGTPDVLGFTLVDNFEANFATSNFFDGAAFDPTTSEMTCRVYGPKVPEKYTDGTTDVGVAVDDGGIDGSAVSILRWLLIRSGISATDIDETSFQSVGPGHALGRAIPRVKSTQSVETYKTVIQEILDSMLWKLGLVRSGPDLKIGLIEIAPFDTDADYTADEVDAALKDFEVDWSDIYYTTTLTYNVRENALPGADQFPVTVLATNDKARAQHLATRDYPAEILQYVSTNAQTIADRLSFILGDRRAFYTFTLGQEFISKGQVGKSFDFIRQFMPGFALVDGTQRTRRLSVIEVEKSHNGVKLVGEDQQGIEDNSGGW